MTPADPLVQAAAAARDRAYAPYSQFRVGAALETADGEIITGCNVENASYGLTMCAERVAVGRAVAEGHTRFTRVAVVTAAAALTPPCGACRQVLWEFAPDAVVTLANPAGETADYRLRDLLPAAFGPEQLGAAVPPTS